MIGSVAAHRTSGRTIQSLTLPCPTRLLPAEVPAEEVVEPLVVRLEEGFEALAGRRVQRFVADLRRAGRGTGRELYLPVGQPEEGLGLLEGVRRTRVEVLALYHEHLVLVEELAPPRELGRGAAALHP